MLLRLRHMLPLLLVLAFLPACAQRQLYRTYGSADGLTNPTIRVLLQDHIGYIWVGTDDGLFRFDGTEFQSFGRNEGLPNNEVHALAEGPDGRLWVGTEGGLAVSDKDRFTALDPARQESIDALGFDSSGTLFTQQRRGIYEVFPAKDRAYQIRQLVSGEVHGLVVSGKRVLFAQNSTLWELGTGQRPKRLDVRGLPEDAWNGIAVDASGNLWVKGSAHLCEVLFTDGSVIDRSGEVHVDAMDHIYAASRSPEVYLAGHDGVTIFRPGGKEVLDDAHGLPSDAGGPVLVDRTGLLWIGTFGDGLVRRLGRGDWLAWTKADRLPKDTVWSVQPLENGTTWVGTNGGVALIGTNDRVVRSFSRKNGLAGDIVLAIAADSTGSVFAGTEPLGVSVFSPDGAFQRTYTAKDGLRGERVSFLATDRLGNVWAAGPAGLFVSSLDSRTHLRRFHEVTTPVSDGHTTFRHIRIADSGEVYVATSRGLLWLQDGQWHLLTQRDGLRINNVSVLALSRGSVWLAYRDSLGISRIDDIHGSPKVTHLSRQQGGLVSDQVVSLASDGEGRVWIGTDRGLQVVRNGRLQQFDTSDGLVWNDTDGGALIAGPGGSLWIGTSRGLSRFHPAASIPQAEQPAEILTLTTTEGRTWGKSEVPTLPPTHNSIDFHFKTFDFAHQASERFRYRLLGLDSAWTETADRSLHATALAAGQYTFEVQVAGRNGTYTGAVDRFTFSVSAPWWRTWWFLTSAGLLVAAAVTALWKYRVRVLTRKQQWLEAQIQLRTAELRDSQSKLEAIAYNDVLTQLPNRRRFNDHLQTHLQADKTFALALIDLDCFKQINDEFGHDAGDAVLVETAHRLSSQVGEGATAYRLGGDEFAILFSRVADHFLVEGQCQRLIQTVSAPIQFLERRFAVGCSIGVAIAPGHCRSSARLYKSADVALYESKKAGRSTFRVCTLCPESLASSTLQAD